MIKRIERYQFEHINMIKNASIHLHKRKFLYTCDARQKQIVEKLRGKSRTNGKMGEQKRLVRHAREK